MRAAGSVYAEDEASLLLDAAAGLDDLRSMVARRIAGEPLELVIGWAAFCGLRVAVAPGVFVPRRRTEALAVEAVLLAREAAAPGRGHGSDDVPCVVDLCCGSGAIGFVVATALEGRLELHAADVEPAAVACARTNLEGFAGTVHEGDLFDALPEHLRGRVDVLAANVPYVPTDEIELLPPEARLHEPRVTLDGGADGLDLLRQVAAGATEWLAPGGGVVVETSERQRDAAVAAFTDAGLTAVVETDEEIGATVVVGRLALP
nr:putative protein N(5)-glutamine methyltransferase [Paraoerskovia sediminicola]